MPAVVQFCVRWNLHLVVVIIVVVVGLVNKDAASMSSSSSSIAPQNSRMRTGRRAVGLDDDCNLRRCTKQPVVSSKEGQLPRSWLGRNLAVIGLELNMLKLLQASASK